MTSLWFCDAKRSPGSRDLELSFVNLEVLISSWNVAVRGGGLGT